MEVKSTLKVFNEADLKPGPGIYTGMAMKKLVGIEAIPSDRICVFLSFFKPGVRSDLHWHLVEAFYYIISGRAVVKDVEGKSYDVGPGSVVYARPGFAGSHSWDIKEELQLLGIRPTVDSETAYIQFAVDEKTKKSSIDFEMLETNNAVVFRKSL